MDSDTQELIAILRARSLKRGTFTLASGAVSDFYLDVKTTALHPEGARIIGRMIAKQLMAEPLLNVTALGGMTLGADPILTAASLAALDRGRVLPALIVRKEPKGHGTLKWVEGIENVPSSAQVLVLEDVVTKGGSSLLAAERLRLAGYSPHSVLTVVDREQGGRELLLQRGLELMSLLSIRDIL